jgi:hypothetical protein
MNRPEPVAWKDTTYGNLHSTNWGGDCEPLYPASALTEVRRAALEEAVKECKALARREATGGYYERTSVLEEAAVAIRTLIEMELELE